MMSGGLDSCWSARYLCASCTVSNHPSARFCVECGLPLGTAMPDAVAGAEALGPYEAPEPADPDTSRLLLELVQRPASRRDLPVMAGA